MFCDEYTNYYDVHIGQKAVLLLNNLGFEVLVVQHNESGRAYISKGFLNNARVLANANVELFNSLITKDVPLIGIEPSAILSFRDEYPNLVDKSLKSNALELSKHVFLIEEFLIKDSLPKYDWVLGSEYQAGDIVQRGGYLYEAVRDVGLQDGKDSASTDLDPEVWNLLAKGQRWKSNNLYST